MKNKPKIVPKKNTLRKRKKRGLFYKVWIILTLFLAFGLLLSRVSEFVNPDWFWAPAFFGFAFPILFVVNFFFMFLYIIKRKRLFFVHFIPVVLTFTMIFRYYQVSSIKKNDFEKTETFTLLSYNIRAFNQFYKTKSYHYLDSLTNFINTISPDIVCFQEFYNNKDEDVQVKEYIQKRLKLNYSYIYINKEKYRTHEFGIATFSKHPIINQGTILNVNYTKKQQTGNFAIFTDIATPRDTIRVYNLHLESNRLSSEDIFFSSTDELKKSTSVEDIPKKSRILLAKLRTSVILRSRQVASIKEHMNLTKTPMIVCGDFNDIPASWTYKEISSGLEDAFIAAGRGSANTYISYVPFLRIDYIFNSPEIKTLYFDTPKLSFSDHYPVYSVSKLPSFVKSEK